MKTWDMGRAIGRSVLVVGLMMQSTPVAWAQLAEIDPALNAAVEALVLADPEVAGDPELARLCRSVAESTVTDIRERVAVAREAAVMQREGVDVNTVIPREVREAAREQFTRVQGEMQRQAEQLRGIDPEKAKEIELRMREGERQMTAFQSGERYVPSTEMVAHAQEMFKSWESDMASRGAPAEFLERARMEMTRFSTGEMQVAFAGPTRDFAGPMPSVEQMQAMGMTADQIQAAQAGGHTLDGRAYGGGSNYGINPATGGWEPGMGGGPGYTGGGMPSVEQMQAMGMTAEQIQHARSMEEMTAGNAVYGVTDWSAGGGTYTGGWEGGSRSAYMPEGWAQNQTGEFHFVGTEGSNYGINPATGGWEPNMGGGTTTGGWESTSSGSTTPTEYTNNTELRQEYQNNIQQLAQEHTRVSTHTVEVDGHSEEHWDGNRDNVPDHTHPIGTGAHH